LKNKKKRLNKRNKNVHQMPKKWTQWKGAYKSSSFFSVRVSGYPKKLDVFSSVQINPY